MQHNSVLHFEIRIILIFRLGLLNPCNIYVYRYYTYKFNVFICFAIDVKIHFLSIDKREAIWFWNGILSFPPPSLHHSAFLSDLTCFPYSNDLDLSCPHKAF